MASANQRPDPEVKRGLFGTVASLDIDHHRCIILINDHGKKLGKGIFDTTKIEEVLEGVSNIDVFLGSSVQLIVTIMPLSRERATELQFYQGKWEVVGARPRGVKPESSRLPRKFISEVNQQKNPGIGYSQQGLSRPFNTDIPVEMIAETISAFRRLFKRWNYFPVKELMNMLQKRRDFVELNLRNHFRSVGNITTFFKSYPQYFALTKDGIVYMPYQFSEDRLKDFITQHRAHNHSRASMPYNLVQSVGRCKRYIDELKRRALQNPPLVLAMDCEGVHLGKEGPLTLVQLGTAEGDVFIFDVLATPNKEDMFQSGGLKGLLEDKNILKVIHDCRSDQCALYFQFGVTLTNVFDTSAAYTTIWDQCNVLSGPFRPKLVALLEVFGFKAQHKTEEFEKKMHEDEIFGMRPLTEEMIEYATDDVLCLVPQIYETMNRLISPLWRPYFEKKVERYLEESRTRDPHEMYEEN